MHGQKVFRDFSTHAPIRLSNPERRGRFPDLDASPLAGPRHPENLQETIYKDLLKRKAQIGTTQWTKKVSPFLFGHRNNLYIFNLEVTIITLKQSLKLL